MIKLELVFFLGILLGAVGWHFLHKFIKHRIDLYHMRQVHDERRAKEENALKSAPTDALLEELSERPTGEFFQEREDSQSQVVTVPPKRQRKKTQ